MKLYAYLLSKKLDKLLKKSTEVKVVKDDDEHYEYTFLHLFLRLMLYMNCGALIWVFTKVENFYLYIDSVNYFTSGLLLSLFSFILWILFIMSDCSNKRNNLIFFLLAFVISIISILLFFYGQNKFLEILKNTLS
ncbi:MAG: hypothetical protein IKO41_15925 [Lachnospiraceae bacterium]|nr:hypothetical protein [Lachnospiraceae bacterium]